MADELLPAGAVVDVEELTEAQKIALSAKYRNVRGHSIVCVIEHTQLITMWTQRPRFLRSSPKQSKFI